MTAHPANRGKYLALSDAAASMDVRCLVIKGAVPSAATILDLNTVTDLLGEAGVSEAAATNYARQDLANVAIAEDDTNDRATWTADAPTINSVGSGETWLACAFYKEGGTDSTRELIYVDEPTSSLATNGSNVTLPQFSVRIT